ncbi:MAG: hypothetical protein L3J30_13160 [Marinosulfonomonas sp.]|nr:hypothetical protein [Marinosulfonomonas sp.]
MMHAVGNDRGTGFTLDRVSCFRTRGQRLRRISNTAQLWNLSVQTAYVAVMATGMVLVIVTRHIDL